MIAVDEAERRGDALAALDLIEQRLHGPDGGLFWCGERMVRLLQIATFERWLPRWAMSRWLLAQALQELGPALGTATDQAVRVAADIRGGLDKVRRPEGEDPRIKLMDYDWVFRQCVLYEFGGLASFLRRASTDLVARADQIHEWTTSPMGGYRYLGSTPAVTMWEDLGTEARIEVPNIGSAVLLVAGECVIGRLVPIESGQMFETLPLEVPEGVARLVASAPADWIESLRGARRRGEDVSGATAGFGFLTDVPLGVSPITLYDGLESPAQLTERAAALLEAVGRAFNGEPSENPDVVDIWACIAAELVDSHVFHALATGLRSNQSDLWARLGRTLAEPAARICRELAEAARNAAA